MGFLQVLEFMFFAVLLTVATIMFMAMSCCYTYYYTSGHGNGFDDIEELIIEEKNEDIPLKHSNHPKHKWSHHEANTGIEPFVKGFWKMEFLMYDLMLDNFCHNNFFIHIFVSIIAIVGIQLAFLVFMYTAELLLNFNS